MLEIYTKSSNQSIYENKMSLPNQPVFQIKYVLIYSRRKKKLKKSQITRNYGINHPHWTQSN